MKFQWNLINFRFMLHSTSTHFIENAEQFINKNDKKKLAHFVVVFKLVVFFPSFVARELIYWRHLQIWMLPFLREHVV